MVVERSWRLRKGEEGFVLSRKNSILYINLNRYISSDLFVLSLNLSAGREDNAGLTI
jgi:hypothetical protein